MDLVKQIDLIERSSQHNRSSAPASIRSRGSSPLAVASLDDKSDSEVLQLHQTIMSDQDLQLDELSQVVSRHKEIGITISNELDLQADILDRVDRNVDRTLGGMAGAQRRLSQIFNNNKGNQCTCAILLLIVILVILIVLTK